MSCDFWQEVKTRAIGGHTLAMITRNVEGFRQWEIVVDCMTQFRGTQHECRGAWLKWVRALNAAVNKNATRNQQTKEGRE